MNIPEELREEWEVLTSGSIEILPRQEFLERLIESRSTGIPLRIKLGCDPSSPDLHIGHTIVINKLAQFQRFGHHVVFIIGNFTARIGDPTGKSETRKSLTAEEASENARTYLDQVFLILDRDKTEVVYNGDWFDRMSMNDSIRLSSRMTVARMMERDDFAKRFASGRPIHIHEFLYPLMQGHDSVEVHADLEIGGTDQKFNLLVGRDLMEQSGRRGQCIMTMPLLVGLDGRQKMSKLLGNSIGLTESPEDMFGKTMSIPDSMMRDYHQLVLSHTQTETNMFVNRIASGELHPRDAKVFIARELVTKYHSIEAANSAESNFNRIFRDHKVPEEIDIIEIKSGDSVAQLLLEFGFVSSKGAAKRLILGGGVSVNGSKITNDMTFSPGDYLLKIGKREFRKVIAK